MEWKKETAISMTFRYWLRKCKSRKPNTICFGYEVGESVYEIAIEELANREDWEHWKQQMTGKSWFTPSMLFFMLQSANEFHGYDIRERFEQEPTF